MIRSRTVSTNAAILRACCAVKPAIALSVSKLSDFAKRVCDGHRVSWPTRREFRRRIGDSQPRRLALPPTQQTVTVDLRAISKKRTRQFSLSLRQASNSGTYAPGCGRNMSATWRPLNAIVVAWSPRASASASTSALVGTPIDPAVIPTWSKRAVWL